MTDSKLLTIALVLLVAHSLTYGAFRMLQQEAWRWDHWFELALGILFGVIVVRMFRGKHSIG